MSHPLLSFPLKPWVAVASVALAVNTAWAADSFVIKDIKVEGLQRVEAATVFASIPVKVGDTYSDERGAAAIRSLFALGLFQDVRIDVRGDNMVIVVQERPVIHSVDVNAGKEIDKATLLGGLSRLGVAPGRNYDKAMEARAIQELLRQYQDRGFFGVEIVPTVTPAERNRVSLLFTVREGYRSRIKDIRFVGNQAFSSSTLQDQMQLDTGNWMSWYTKSDVYSENKLNTDLDAIRRFYHDRGYMAFKVDSVQTTIAPDKRDMSVVVHVTEGARYVVSGVSLAGNYLGKDEEFQSLVRIRPGEPYKLEDVQATIDAMKRHFGSYGHAFARIEARPRIDQDKNQQVELVLVAEPGQRAYIRRVNVVGNTKTRDEVIRREVRQYEASWYDAEKIRLSRERLERLGYFTDISIDTQPVGGSPDQADLVVTVKERPTGSIQLGAGYSSTDKLTLSLGLSQDNIFGSGQSFSLNINTGKYDRTYALSSTDPYFTTSGISRTFYVSHSVLEPKSGQGGDYRVRSDAAGVSFGVPFSEKDTIHFGLGLERYAIRRNTTELPPSYQAYIDYYGNSAFGIPLSVGWSRDSRDSALVPTSGSLQRINAILSPGGDMRYAMATYKFQQFFPLSKNLTLMFNADAGYGKGLSCRKDASAVNCFPFYKNFFVGGVGSIRGFEYGGIGPQEQDPVSNTVYSVGGNKMFNTNLEVIAPFPGAHNDKTLRLFAFLDAGNVYAPASTSADRRIRASAGFGLRWVSPMGPLSLSYGHPFRKQSTDKLQKFQFQMGTTF
ncbi:MAG: outer membrane protein assembly factor BamA [Brachymonas sp.]